MLLLAAETVADCCASSKSALSSMTSTELIARSAAAGGCLHGTALSSLSSTRMIHNTINQKMFSAEPFDSLSSAGDSDTATPVPESVDDEAPDGVSDRGNEFGYSLNLVHVSVSNRQLAVVDTDVIKNVLEYLTWRDNLVVRRVNRSWFEASLSQAVVCRMPVTSCPAIFLPCRHDLESQEEADETRFSSVDSAVARDDLSAVAPWMCHVCGWYNDRRPLCGNRNCQSAGPRSACDAIDAASRIFLGQLRREATVPLIRWMFEEVLLEPTSLLMVENHRHKVTGRGKGCAWVYVRKDGPAVANLLSYHRRLFLDCVNGVEGAWIVHPQHLDALQREVASRGYAPDRPRTLPRNALVTELPLAQMRLPVEPAVQQGEVAAMRHPSSLSPFAPPFVTNNIPESASAAALPSYQEAVGLHLSAGGAKSVGVSPVHMISPTIRRHNPYAAAV